MGSFRPYCASVLVALLAAAPAVCLAQSKNPCSPLLKVRNTNKDASSALTQCINKGNGKIPAGVYAIEKPILITKKNASLSTAGISPSEAPCNHHAGVSCAIFMRAPTFKPIRDKQKKDAPILDIVLAVVGQGVTIDHVEFDGMKSHLAAVGAPRSALVSITACKNCSIRSVAFGNSIAESALSIAASKGVHVINSSFISNGSQTAVTAGIHVQDSQGVTIQGNVFKHNSSFDVNSLSCKECLFDKNVALHSSAQPPAVLASMRFVGGSVTVSNNFVDCDRFACNAAFVFGSVASATVRNAKRTSESTNVGSAKVLGNIAANSFYGVYLGAQSKVDVTEPYSLGTTGTATCPNMPQGAYLAAAPGVPLPAALERDSVTALFPFEILSPEQQAACSTSGRSEVPAPPPTAPSLQQVLAVLTPSEIEKLAVSLLGGSNNTSDVGSPVGSGSADSDGSNVSTGSDQVEISIPATGTGTDSTTGEAPGSGNGGDTSTGSDISLTDTSTTADSTTDAATSESATAGTGSDTTTASDSGYVDTRMPTTDTETGSNTSTGSDNGYTDTATTAGSTSNAASGESAIGSNGSGSVDSDGSNVSTGHDNVEISIPARETGSESTTGEMTGSGTGGDTSTDSDTGYFDTKIPTTDRGTGSGNTSTGSDTSYNDPGTTAGSPSNSTTGESATGYTGSGSADSNGSNVSTGTGQVEISIPATGTGTDSTTGEAPGSGTGGDTSTGSDTGYTDTSTTTGSTSDAATGESATGFTGSGGADSDGSTTAQTLPDDETSSDSDSASTGGGTETTSGLDDEMSENETATGTDNSAHQEHMDLSDEEQEGEDEEEMEPADSPAPPSGKCCICQYMERAECGPIATQNECDTKLLGSTKDCRWDVTEKVCRSRFHDSCLKFKAEKEGTIACPNGVIVIDDKKDIATLKLSCSQIEWQRDGHDNNCELTGTAIKACLECSSGDCSFVNNGCSVLQDWSEVERLIQSVKSQLKEGQGVTLTANQAVSAPKVCSQTTINITNESSTVQYPLCKDLGMPLGSLKHWCLKSGETARCQMADGTLLWARCCPAKQFYGFFPIRFCSEENAWTPISWDGVGSPPTCSNVAVTHGTCRAEGPNSSPETRREVQNQVSECEKKASGDCLRSAGSFFLGEIKSSHAGITSTDANSPYWWEWPWRCEKRMNAVSCSSWDDPPPPWDPPSPPKSVSSNDTLPAPTCILGDTDILLADGTTKKAREVSKSDTLLGVRLSSLTTQPVTVSDVLPSEKPVQIYELTTASGRSLRFSASHPIWSSSKGSWVAVDPAAAHTATHEAVLPLEVGDSLLVVDSDGSTYSETVTGVRDTERLDVVYRFLNVSEDHTYVTGGFVSHNKPY